MVSRLRAWSDTGAWVLADASPLPEALRPAAVEPLTEEQYAAALDAAAGRGEVVVLRGGKPGERCVEVRVRTSGADPVPFGDVVADGTFVVSSGTLVFIGAEALPWWEPGAPAKKRAVSVAEGVPTGRWRATLIRPRVEAVAEVPPATGLGWAFRAAAVAVPVLIGAAVTLAKQGYTNALVVLLPIAFLLLNYLWRAWVASRVEEPRPRPEERHLVVVLAPLPAEPPTGGLLVTLDPSDPPSPARTPAGAPR